MVAREFQRNKESAEEKREAGKGLGNPPLPPFLRVFKGVSLGCLSAAVKELSCLN
jgi:hypothetical protein